VPECLLLTQGASEYCTRSNWVRDIAGTRMEAQFELIALAHYPLPVFDEAMPPSPGKYGNEHTKQ
jgi:hypothetical protein